MGAGVAPAYYVHVAGLCVVILTMILCVYCSMYCSVFVSVVVLHVCGCILRILSCAVHVD